jgi:hypothetical protein
MPAIMQQKTVNVASFAAPRQAPLPKAAPRLAAAKTPRKSFFDFLRIALSAPMAY